ncbi:hypothetical protein MBLNU230_g2887t1 [Neophaeotheca triangularis]
MGKIKKTPTERHSATVSPAISQFVEETTTTPLHLLPQLLKSFPQNWPFPRGDLYHWIPLLDRFDHVLELFTQEYALTQGPQTQPFERRLLIKGDAEQGTPYPGVGSKEQELDTLGYSVEGDRELIETLVHFTRILLEHCGNRSLYASSGHIDYLLRTTSLSLLRSCLRLGLRLAQRYQVARYKNNSPQNSAALLANHYNFSIDNLQKLAMPFPRPQMAQAAPLATPGKGKEKEKGVQAIALNMSDLVQIAKEPEAVASKADLAAVAVTYYDQASSVAAQVHEAAPSTPGTPTLARQRSNLVPASQRSGVGDRATNNNEQPETPVKQRSQEGASSSAPKTYKISSAKLANTPAWALMKEAVATLPIETQYEVLNRVRIAKAFSEPARFAQPLVETRLLAVANLAYALGDSKFQEKVGTPDAEEPKQFHLAQQLCDLLQPPKDGQAQLSLEAETTVLQTLEALTKVKHKTHEVSDALSIAVNHGVLYYELRKAIATLHKEEHADRQKELGEIEWRDATFDLVNALTNSNAGARQADKMVAAGIMGILVEVLNLRTTRAERFYERVIGLFDSFIHGIQHAFQNLSTVKGFDAIANLTGYEVEGALEDINNGRGLDDKVKSKVVDYTITFHRQATLRQLFRFIIHMFEHGTGVHDRLLRNLIDSPPLLNGLRSVISNAQVFGSNVWGGAVTIVTSFIHNEPTSYQVIAEAGLSTAILETITHEPLPTDLPEDSEFIPDAEATLPAVSVANGNLEYPSFPGILPVGETMVEIPGIFGAICLNEGGMKMFKASGALNKFLGTFLSPVHVRAMEEDGSSAAGAIGQAFDELSRHHPQLKEVIMSSVVAMVRRIVSLCQLHAEHNKVGAKLWLRTKQGFEASGGSEALSNWPAERSDNAENKAILGADLDEREADRVTATPYISACFKFLAGFFSNASMTASFCEKGGAELLMDLLCSPSQSSDLTAFHFFGKATAVIKMMCDAKPHLVLPSLTQRAQIALRQLKPLMNEQRASGFFDKYCDMSQILDSSATDDNGSTIVKSLRVAHVLALVLGKSIGSTPQQAYSRAQPFSQLFLAVNFADVYVELVDDYSRLHATCLREDLLLQTGKPDDWKDATRPRQTQARRIDANGFVQPWGAQTNRDGSNGDSNATASRPKDDPAQAPDAAGFSFKNGRTARYLLTQTPVAVETFFQSLGQALLPKRIQEPQKQSYMAVAERIANAAVWELGRPGLDALQGVDRMKYLVHVLSSCTRMLLRSSSSMMDTYGQRDASPLLLSKFYAAGGLDKLSEHLSECVEKLRPGNPVLEQNEQDLAKEAANTVLRFFANIARFQFIQGDQFQVGAMLNKEVASPDYWTPGQFVVEIRLSVLKAMHALWQSDSISSLPTEQARIIVDTLRVILQAEGERDALKRSSHARRRLPARKHDAASRTDHLETLEAQGFPHDLAMEAIHRCNYDKDRALEYCRLRQSISAIPRYPAPSSSERSASASAAPAASGNPLERQISVDMSDAEDTVTRTTTTSSSSDQDAGTLGSLPADMAANVSEAMATLDASGGVRAATGLSSTAKDDTRQGELYPTVDDLNDQRKELRSDLVDRCLDVLSSHPSMTFELSDLIQGAVADNVEGATQRTEIGRTLVSSLVSLGMDEGAEAGRKIYAYAHLVAIILQDNEFFLSTLDELKEYFDQLVGWVELQPQQKAEDAPWLEMILVIIERVLSEDEQPAEVKWETPPPDDPLRPLPEVQKPELIVSAELRNRLFRGLVDVLPKINKNSPLAISVCRVLTILTRRRELAQLLGQKQNLGRLFTMIRQVSCAQPPGNGPDKLHGCFLLIVRHMIEDEQMLRQIMTTEIRASFEGHRSRNMDTTSYTRNLYHLVLRDPDIFVDVTKDLVEVARFDGQSQRAQSLALKKTQPSADTAGKAAEEGKDQQAAATEQAAPSVEDISDSLKLAEPKAPFVETSDGVINFLLGELSKYKDAEDPDPRGMTSPKSNEQKTSTGDSSNDVEMADANSGTGTTPGSAAAPAPPEAGAASPGKKEFNPEQHTIFIYRCFVLQCLSELLACYDRTKIEFINFSRKSDSQPATPSKPRAGTINYLLNQLIPIGTLEHRDDVSHRKKAATSNCAITVLVSLCSKTQERLISRPGPAGTNVEDDTDLAFVRKFVLEHALRAFKEAMTSQEPLDSKYSRLLSLGDLFNRMLTGKPDRNFVTFAENFAASQQQLGRLMYEKNFIGALTSSIAELDLNFPNAKRAVKHILSPLKWLTDLAVTLSQTLDLSSSSVGAGTDDDSISSATSLSEDEDEEREHTPDLFRNTTLGMLEAGGNRDDEESDDDEEDDEDEDMYEGDYDEEMEMEYDDEQVAEHGDVVSDEDDEEGMGDVEGMPGDRDMNVEIVMDDDEDDDDDESSDDEDDDDDDEQEFADQMDEITGDDDNASLADREDEGDWEDDGDEYEIDDEGVGSPHGGPLDHIAHVIGAGGAMDEGEDEDVMHVEGDGGNEEYFEDEMGPDGEDEDEEEDYNAENYGNELVYEPEMEDDDDEEGAFGWDDVPPPAIARGGGHHHPHFHHRGFNNLLFGGMGGPGRPPFRGHPNREVPSAGEDENANPLLQRGAGAHPRAREIAVDMPYPRVGRRHPQIGGRLGEEGLLQDLMAVMGPHGQQRLNVAMDPAALGGMGGMPPVFITGGRHGGAGVIDIDPHRFGPPGSRWGVPMPGGSYGSRDMANTDEARAVEFTPTLTINRWQDEAKLVFGNRFLEKSTRVIHALLRHLLPPAMEAKRQHDKAERERRDAEQKARDEELKKAEAERIEREAREKKEREEREAKEAEEAAERARAEAARAHDQPSATQTGAEESEPAEMEGVENTQATEQPAEAANTDPPSERMMYSLRGREVDITHLGIDPGFLEALPEEMRDEVIMSQLAEQGAQAVTAGEEPGEISPEFLEALPPDMQRELLRGEADRRRRRARQDERDRAAEAGVGNAQPPQPEEMSREDFLATLAPGLRQQVLMETDEATLVGLGPDILAEARQYGRPPGMGRMRRAEDLQPLAERANATRAPEDPGREPSKQRRPTVQMLDKAGVATLLRLMFVSLQSKAKSSLHGVLSDVCKNTQNRAEVISILLSILQDGTGDVAAVEKSFAQLSLRAKQLSGPKTPQPVKRSLTGQIMTLGTELSPLNIVQQCLSTLNALANDNPRVPSFFLTEHETFSTQNAKALKKGKGRDTKAAKFPINALLSLIDKKIIIENQGVMETLAAILSRVTNPLTILLKKAKEAQDAANKTQTEERPTTATSDVAMGEAPPAEGAATEQASEEATDAKPSEEKDDAADGSASKKKKHRELEPPEIPEANIRLVVSILAARDCVSKTFSDTLDVIKNMSAIPGAKEVFSKELMNQAQELAQGVLADLEELAKQIKNTDSGTELQGVALANFSTVGSKPRKLLRIITALDYLSDPKRTPSSEKSAAHSQEEAKLREDILAAFQEHPTFEKMWARLSDCLAAIRDRNNMISIATILMPLIECLFVVCRNAIKDEQPAKDGKASLAQSPEATTSVSSPTPEDRPQSIFFQFTSDHRKILNELIRNTPKLMNTSFQILHKNAKVLDFDNKRNYFTRKLHHRGSDQRHPHPSLQLNVRRERVFHDSFKALYYKSPQEIKYGKLNIRFQGEEGVDAGGVSREWFAAMARQMFNPDFALFNPVASDRTTFHPNKLSDVNDEHLVFFKFIGRIIGKALYEGRLLDCHFSRAVYKKLLGIDVNLSDMESLDLDYYKSLDWMWKNDITGVLDDNTFTDENDRFGAVEIVDLKPNGRNIEVTEENKKEYITLINRYRLVDCVKEQLDHFLQGFHEIVPEELIRIFDAKELELLISGLPDIDVDEWKNNTDYSNYTATSPQVQWFWRAVRSFDKEEKAKLLQFVTGTSKVPLNGFKELEGMNGFQKFNIHRDFSNTQRLPTSHTCFNQLDLPEYESYEQLRQQLYTAFTVGNDYFGFA